MLNSVYGSCSKELTLYPHIVLCSLEFTGRFLTIYWVEFYCTPKKTNIVNNDLGNMKQL